MRKDKFSLYYITLKILVEKAYSLLDTATHLTFSFFCIK